MSSSNIGKRVRTGIKWTALGMAATRLARLAGNVVLARLLSIEAFGVVAMANTAIVLVGALREAGLGQAYVQRKEGPGEDPHEAIDTVFIGMVFLNGLLFAFVVFLAPSVASFFRSDADMVEPVIRGLATLFLLDAFVSPPMFALQRRMAFDQIARSEVVGSAANVSVAITAAVGGAGVWSLVAGQVAERLAMASTLAWSARWTPRLRGSWRIGKDLIRFGKYLWGFALVRSIGKIADRVMVGKIHGATGLGGYSQAFNLCNLPASVIAQVVNRVAVPAMARMQSDLEKLRSSFLKAFTHVTFLAIPAGVGLVSLSDVLVPLLYGEKWAPIVPIVNVLAGYGTVLAIASVGGPVFQAKGRPQLILYIELLRQALLLPLLLLFAYLGEVTVAWCVFGTMLLLSALSLSVAARLLEIRARALLQPLISALVTAAAMYAALAALRGIIPQSLGNASELFLSTTFGALVYLILSTATNRSMMRDVLDSIRKVIVARSR